MTASAASAFPIIIAEWDRNSREIIRVALDRYKGRLTVNARVWYRDGDEVRPTKQGLTLSIKHLAFLSGALEKTALKIIELGLDKEGASS